MVFLWDQSCFAYLRYLICLSFTNTYEFHAIKSPKRETLLPIVVKTTCSPLSFFSPLNWYIPKSVKALSLK